MSEIKLKIDYDYFDVYSSYDDLKQLSSILFISNEKEFNTLKEQKCFKVVYDSVVICNNTDIHVTPYIKTIAQAQQLFIEILFRLSECNLKINSLLLNCYSQIEMLAKNNIKIYQQVSEVKNGILSGLGKEYTINKVDIPKCNYKIEFIPLSKCAGYEGLDDRINLCDVVTVKDTRYNIDTQAKVIKVTYNVLRDRYESMELGEPKTTLGDIIGGTGNGPMQGPPGPPGPQGPAGADGSIGDFPESLPSVPQITAKVYGFANIELSWTFENKVYYSYELYASKTKGFVPNTFNLIFSGQASTCLYQVEPNETWYFRACAINTHGQRTEFSAEVKVNTVKISDLSNYVESAAIGDALIGELNLGRGWYGELRGNYIDAKQMSVTDGNGKRTLDIDSFGNVNLDVTSLRINSESVATSTQTSQSIKDEVDKLKNEVNQQITEVEDQISDLGDILSDAFRDGIIDEAEAKAIQEHLKRLDTEKADVDAQYNELYTNEYLK